MSILYQSYSQFELILINDGSVDNSMQKVQQFTDRRIRVTVNDNNLGIAFCRLAGIAAANGKYLCWLDADDIALPNRLALHVAAFESNPNLVLCAGGALLLQNGKVSTSTFVGLHNNALKVKLFFEFPFTNSSIALRSDVAKKYVASTQHYKQAEDYILYSLLLREGDFELLNQPLVKYRIHESNTRITNDRNNADIVHGRMIAWRNILGYLELQTNDAVLNLHDKMSYYPARLTHTDLVALPDYLWLLQQMRKQNERLGIFEPNAFARSISHAIYTVLLHPMVPAAVAWKWWWRNNLLLTASERLKLPANKWRRSLFPHIKS